VDARRAPAPVDFNCVPAAESVDPETREVTGEIVRLMAPNTPEIYRASRSGKLGAAGIKLDPAGRPPKLKPDQKKLLTTLPDDWLNAIGVETGELRGRLQSRGRPRTQADMLIAATAKQAELTVATRNVADFSGCGVRVFDPWSG
jgi:hypothetical protein